MRFRQAARIRVTDEYGSPPDCNSSIIESNFYTAPTRRIITSGFIESNLSNRTLTPSLDRPYDPLLFSRSDNHR